MGTKDIKNATAAFSVVDWCNVTDFIKYPAACLKVILQKKFRLCHIVRMLALQWDKSSLNTNDCVCKLCGAIFCYTIFYCTIFRYLLLVSFAAASASASRFPVCCLHHWHEALKSQNSYRCFLCLASHFRTCSCSELAGWLTQQWWKPSNCKCLSLCMPT